MSAIKPSPVWATSMEAGVLSLPRLLQIQIELEPKSANPPNMAVALHHKERIGPACIYTLTRPVPHRRRRHPRLCTRRWTEHDHGRWSRASHAAAPPARRLFPPEALVQL